MPPKGDRVHVPPSPMQHPREDGAARPTEWWGQRLRVIRPPIEPYRNVAIKPRHGHSQPNLDHRRWIQCPPSIMLQVEQVRTPKMGLFFSFVDPRQQFSRVRDNLIKKKERKKRRTRSTQYGRAAPIITPKAQLSVRGLKPDAFWAIDAVRRHPLTWNRKEAKNS